MIFGSLDLALPPSSVADLAIGDLLRVGNDHDLDPAVDAPVCRGVVRHAGPGVRVAGGGETGGGQAVALDQHPQHLGGAGGGELPVAREHRAGDGQVVRVTLDDDGVV